MMTASYIRKWRAAFYRYNLSRLEPNILGLKDSKRRLWIRPFHCYLVTDSWMVLQMQNSQLDQVAWRSRIVALLFRRKGLKKFLKSVSHRTFFPVWSFFLLFFPLHVAKMSQSGAALEWQCHRLVCSMVKWNVFDQQKC